MSPSGLLLREQTGANHLMELREVIYPVVKSADAADTCPAGFTRTARSTVHYQIPRLEQTAISELLLMTPHLYRASAQGKQRVAQLQELSLTVDVTLEVLRKA